MYTVIFKFSRQRLQNNFPTHTYIYTTHTYTQPEPQREFEVVAMYNRPPIRMDELRLIKGKELTVLDSSKGDWWFARNQRG